MKKEKEKRELPPAVSQLAETAECHAMPHCPIRVTQNIFSGKWKLLILAQLFEGPVRYGALQRAIPEISEKMLIQSLRQLEADRMLERHAYPEVPPRVEYRLTEHGRKLEPVVQQMINWGLAYLAAFSPANQ